MALAEAATIVRTLKDASELIRQLRSSDDKETLRTGISQLTEMLADARLAALDLISDKAELEDKVRTLERENSRLLDFEGSGRFDRVQTTRGHFVYVEKESPNGPFFCPTCYSAHRLSILARGQHDSYHACHVCHWTHQL